MRPLAKVPPPQKPATDFVSPASGVSPATYPTLAFLAVALTLALAGALGEGLHDQALYLAIVAGPLLLAVCGHEAAHALAAKALGDPTAARAGRASLNPILHFDPVGTALVPILLVSVGLPPVGWAKMVPFDPARLRGWRMQLFALAGPAFNVASALAWSLGTLALAGAGGSTAAEVARTVCLVGAVSNALMAAFNLLPIPPLDGGKVWCALLPEPARLFVLRHEVLGLALLVSLMRFGWMVAFVSSLAGAFRF